MHAKIILRPAFSLALIALVGLLAYSNSFTVPFQFDDNDYIVHNPVIGNLSLMLSPPRDLELSSNLNNTLRPRIIVMMSFWLNYRLGGLNPVGYHIVNFLIHLGNATLVYMLVMLTLRPTIRESPSAMDYAPLISALLFVSHPLQTQAVTNITQRFTSMATLFYLGSLLAYIVARREGWNKRGYALYGLCLLSAALGMKSKEIAFTLPLSAALYDYLFLAGDKKTRLMALVPLFLIAAIVPLSHIASGESLADASKATLDHTRAEYLISQSRVLVTYVRLFFFPVGQSLLYTYPVSNSFFEPAVLSSTLFLLTIFSGGIWLAFRGRGIPARLAGFGVVWFFITISIESSVFPLTSLIDEHRTYLPSFGFFTVFSIGAAYAIEHAGKIKQLALGGLFLIAMILALVTHERNVVWQSEISLWQDVVKKFPGKARGHYNLSIAYKKAGREEEARKHHLITATLDDSFKRDFYQGGLSLYNAASYDAAIRQFQIALKTPPHSPTGPMGDAAIHTDLGNAYMAKGMIANAVTHYEEALKLDPDAPSTNNNLANAYDTMGNTEKAIYYYKAALSHNPDVPDIHFNLAMLYAGMGRKKEARAEFETVLRISPNDAQAREELDKLAGPSK